MERRKEGRNERAGGERREGWRRTLRRGRKVGAIEENRHLGG